MKNFSNTPFILACMAPIGAALSIFLISEDMVLSIVVIAFSFGGALHAFRFAEKPRIVQGISLIFVSLVLGFLTIVFAIAATY